MRSTVSDEADFENCLKLMNQFIPYKLFAHCIPVRGIERSTICDLQRNKVHLIPNSLFDLLHQTQGLTIAELKDSYAHEFDEIFDEYFTFLDTEELIFLTRNPTFFPEISLQWHSPSIITNAIIDLNGSSALKWEELAEELNNLDCKFVEIRCYETMEILQYQKLIDGFKDTTVISISLILPFNSNNTDGEWDVFCDQNWRITSLKLHNSLFEKFIFSKEKAVPIAYIQKKINNEHCCGIITSNYFTASIDTFTESQHFNTCLNRKISIDVDGNIKNCPSMKESFGNIRDTTLEEALNKPGFKKYWNIAKDEITKCKDCEFRHVCTDCRAYLENPEDIYSAPLKCGYNPYTCEWEDWSTNPLKEKAMAYYGIK